MKEGTNFIRRRLSHLTRLNIVKPSYFTFELTNKCNFFCKYCDQWKIKPDKELSLLEWKCVSKKIFDWMGPYNVKLSGGEPFLKKNIFDLIRYNNNLGIKTMINSNGYLIDDKLAEKIVKSNVHFIKISLISFNKDVNEDLRGRKDVFEKSMNAVKKLVYWKQKLNSNINISLAFLMNSQNLEEVEEMILWAKKIGVRIYLQVLVHNFKSDVRENLEKSELWPKNKKQIKEVFRKIILLKKNNYPIVQSMPILKLMREYFLRNEKIILRTPCKISYYSFIVDPEGNVRFCFGRHKNGLVGNIKEDSPKDIWFSKQSNIERENIRNCREFCRVHKPGRGFLI
ncbi:MAG: radical SAM protein [DPANN group archaeon]|nr:radical SAM protein [DPANN group archaeon]